MAGIETVDRRVESDETLVRIELKEWEQTDRLLSGTAIRDLLRISSSVVRVQTLPDGKLRLQAGSYVGRLRLGSVSLRITPKTPIRSLLWVMAEAYDLVRLDPYLVGYGTDADLSELFADIYLRHVERVIRQGLKRNYIEQENELVAVRGRIEWPQTIDRHLRGKPRVFCRYEDFTLDGPENRLLLAAIRAIEGNRSLSVVRRNLAHRVAEEFVGVRDDMPTLMGFPPAARDRLNQHYHPSLELAALILQGTGMSLQCGAADGAGFLLDMNSLFERFVSSKLTKFLVGRGTRVSSQRSSSFDRAGYATIRPDLLIRDESGRRLVADAKYKVGENVDSADLYQMFSYCGVLQVSHGLLLTVGKAAGRRYVVNDGRTTIETFPLDLSGSPAEFDGALHRLASRIASILESGNQ